MESTGKYWVPVFNLLEDSINVTIANPKWVKTVKGNKEFIVSDCQSVAIMDRWVLKIAALEEKKRHYEELLQKELDELGEEFSTFL